MFRKISIGKLALWLFIVMLLSFGVSGAIMATKGVGGIFLGQGKVKSYPINIEKKFSMDEIKNISVDTVSTDVKIVPTDINEIKVHFYGDAATNNTRAVPELITKNEGGKLAIEIKHKRGAFIGFNFKDDDTKLEISIPKSYNGSLKSDTISGDLSIRELAFENLVINTVSGDIIISNLHSKNTNVETISGDANIEKLTGNLNYNSVSGSISAQYAALDNNIKIETVSGDSKLALPGDSEFTLDFDSVSGDFNSEFAFVTSKGRERNKFSGKVGSKDNVINISTTSGDCQINRI